MRRNRPGMRRLQWGCAVALSAWMGLAQAALTLESFIEALRVGSPQLQALRLEQRVAEAELEVSRALPSPSVSVGFEREDRQREFMVSQPLWVFGQSRARVAVAESALRSSLASQRARELEWLRAAAHHYVDAMIAQARYRMLNDADQALREVHRIVDGQVQAGARSQYDGVRVKMADRALKSEIAQLRTEALQAEGQLATLLGKPLDADIRFELQRPNLSTQEVEVWLSRLGVLPEIALAQQEWETAEAQVKLAEAQTKVVPVVNLGHQVKRMGGSSYMVGVEVNVPLFDRNAARIDQAKAQAMVARSRYEALRQTSLLHWERKINAARQHLELIRELESRPDDELQSIQQMAADSYLLGQSSVMELLEAHQQVLEIRQHYLELLEKAWSSAIEVRYSLIGFEL